MSSEITVLLIQHYIIQSDTIEYGSGFQTLFCHGWLCVFVTMATVGHAGPASSSSFKLQYIFWFLICYFLALSLKHIRQKNTMLSKWMVHDLMSNL